VYVTSKLMAATVTVSNDRFEVSGARALFDLSSLAGTFGAYPYDVSAGGQRFLVITEERAAPVPITLVLNRTAGLKK